MTDPSTGTTIAVDWVTLATPEFVAWSRAVDVELPFPLRSGDVPYLEAPDRASIDRILGERGLADSRVLAAARASFSTPRLVVYAVRMALDGAETKVVAVAGRDQESAVLVLLDSRQTSLRPVSDTELAAGVVGALPRLAALPIPSVEVAVETLQHLDRVQASADSPRTLRLESQQAGLPEALIAALERTAPGSSLPTGVLGAVRFPTDGGDARHSTRSATWREFPDGTLLEIERTSRRGDPSLLLTPCSADALFRATADAVASCFE